MRMSIGGWRAGLTLACAVLGGAVAPFALIDCSGGSSGGGPADAASEADTSAFGLHPDATTDASDAGDAAADTGSSADATMTTDAGAEDAPSDGAIQDADASTTPCEYGDAGEALDLRCGTLYSNFDAKTVASGVRMFDPGLHLWSDGAVKTRWIELPPGTTIDASNMDEWVFPVGTKFWKEFALGGVRVETRLLWKTGPGTWYPTTYRWSADGQSDATELLTGEKNATDAGYEVPSQPECFTCHQGRKDFILGFEAVSLASAAAVAASPLNMDTLVSLGLLSNVPADAGSLVIPGTPVEQAALGYLHANCGTACHNRNMTAATFGRTTLYMRLDVAKLGSVQATDTYTTAWNQPTNGFMLGAFDRIAACSLATSCVYYRPSHRDGLNGAPTGTQMPPIDTHAIDPTGLATIAAWIDEGCPDAGALDGGTPDAEGD